MPIVTDDRLLKVSKLHTTESTLNFRIQRPWRAKLESIPVDTGPSNPLMTTPFKSSGGHVVGTAMLPTRCPRSLRTRIMVGTARWVAFVNSSRHSSSTFRTKSKIPCRPGLQPVSMLDHDGKVIGGGTIQRRPCPLRNKPGQIGHLTLGHESVGQIPCRTVETDDEAFRPRSATTELPGSRRWIRVHPTSRNNRHRCIQVLACAHNHRLISRPVGLQSSRSSLRQAHP